MINPLSSSLELLISYILLRTHTFCAFPFLIASLLHLSQPCYVFLLSSPFFHHCLQYFSFSFFLPDNNDLNGFMIYYSFVRMEEAASSVSPELVSLTFGAFISQIVKDYENEVEINKQIELLGYFLFSFSIIDFI